MRRAQRVLRNASEGVTWKVTPQGSRLAIEIVFDDEPDRPIARERVLAPHERAGGLDALIAEQVADGFVLEPAWAPTADWIRSAETGDLGLEVVDAWVLALHADPSLWSEMPASVKSFLALDTMLVQARRNGLSSFIREDDPRLVAHVLEAARHTGLTQVETLFARATDGLDLAKLARSGAAPVRWGSAQAASAIEMLAATLEVDDRLIAWIREHADDFASIATLRPA